MTLRTLSLSAGLVVLGACGGAADDSAATGTDVVASPGGQTDAKHSDGGAVRGDGATTIGPDGGQAPVGSDGGAAAGADVPGAGPDGAAPADAAGDADGTSAVDLPDGAVVVTAPAAWVTAMEREPRNLHMAWEHDPARSMTVSWATTDATMQGYVPRLWVAPRSLVTGDGDDLVMPVLPGLVFEGTGLFYSEMFNGVPLGGEYAAWHTEATGLEPDTEYVYRVGAWDSFDEATGTFAGPNLSPPRTFRTGHVKGDREPLRFVLAGDSRGGMESISAQADRLGAIDASVWFFNGDFTASGLQWEFDAWWEAMGPIVEHRPLMGVQGNHELFADLFYAQLAFPHLADVPVEYDKHAWSLDLGNVHFVGLDSNTDEAVVDLVPWLDGDLAAARKDPDIDWIVVMAHHPPFSSSHHGSTVRVQEHWLPVFDAHDVDVVFTGHDHDYERTQHIRDMKVVGEGGVVYVVAGGFFSPPYDNGNDWWTATSSPGEKANYVEVEVTGTHFKATAWSGDGSEILDTFSLDK